MVYMLGLYVYSSEVDTCSDWWEVQDVTQDDSLTGQVSVPRGRGLHIEQEPFCCSDANWF